MVFSLLIALMTTKTARAMMKKSTKELIKLPYLSSAAPACDKRNQYPDRVRKNMIYYFNILL